MERNKQQIIRLLTLITCGLLVQCSGGNKSSPSEALSKAENREEINSDLPSVVFSNSDNFLTSRRINKQKAKALLAKLQKSLQSEPKQAKEHLTYLIAAERFSDENLSQIIETAKKLADIELQSGVEREISDSVKLELALAAIQNKNFSFAELYLDDLSKSKSKRVKAGAENAKGIIALIDGRIPEAVEFWKEALRVDANYEASLLNLGFVALMYGNFEFAKKMFEKIDDDWFAESGMLVASRLMGDTAVTSKLCDKLLVSHKEHKATIFNCGVHEWQSNRNLPKAKQLMQKAISLRGGPSSWSEEGEKTLAKVK